MSLHVVSPLEGVAHSLCLFRVVMLADRHLLPASHRVHIPDSTLVLEGLGQQSDNQGMATGIETGRGLKCQV